MVRTIHENFDDEEFVELVKVKGLLTWREFILTLLEEKDE